MDDFIVSEHIENLYHQIQDKLANQTDCIEDIKTLLNDRTHQELENILKYKAPKPLKKLITSTNIDIALYP